MSEPAVFPATREYSRTSLAQIRRVFLLPLYKSPDPPPLLSPRPYFSEIFGDLIQVLACERLGVGTKFDEHPLFDVFNTTLDLDVFPSGIDGFNESFLSVTHNHQSVVRNRV